LIIATRRSFAIILLLVVAGCGPTSPSASPGGTSSAVASPPTPASNASASGQASASATNTAPASVGPSSAACPALPQTGVLPSDRFVNVKVAAGATADRLTFVFGNASLPGPASPPQGALEVARPPYTEAGSGAPIAIEGQHVVQVRFTGMSLSNDVGQPTYNGPSEVTPDLVALQNAILFDASEGVIGWYVGYDGSGCLTLVRESNEVMLVIGHG